MTTAGTFRDCSTFITADLVFFGLKQGLISINSVNSPLVGQSGESLWHDRWGHSEDLGLCVRDHAVAHFSGHSELEC
jgi:hypothetical protein